MMSVPLTYWMCAHWILIDRETNPHLDGITFFLWPNTEPVTRDGFGWYLLYMYAGVLLPYFIGLHYSYLSIYPALENIQLNSERMKTFSLRIWLLLLFFVLVGVLAIVYHFYLFYRIGVIIEYSIGIVAALFLFGVFIAYQLIVNKKHFHLHHWLLFGPFIIFGRTQNIISALLVGLLVGICVDEAGWCFFFFD